MQPSIDGHRSQRFAIKIKHRQNAHAPPRVSLMIVRGVVVASSIATGICEGERNFGISTLTLPHLTFPCFPCPATPPHP
jgi:hypothetical protein